MAYSLSFLREPLICKGNFPFPLLLAIVAIKEPQDIRAILKLKWLCLSPAKLSVLPKLKFPVYSHLEYMLQKVFKMTGVTLTIGRLLLKDIYWYQTSSRRFIHSRLFIHSHSHKGRAYSSCFMHVIVARMRLPFFKLFSSFVYFCPNFQTNYFFLTWFCPFSKNLRECPYFLE